MALLHPPSLQSALCGALALLLALCPALGWAQAGEEPDEGAGLLLGLRGVGEAWQEPTLIRELGRSSRFGGTAFISYHAWRFLSVDVEAGYHRQDGTWQSPSGKAGVESTTFEMIPIALSASASHRVGKVQVFGSVGAAATVFTHEAPEKTTTGTKVGPAFHVGARLDTGLVQPSIRRDAAANRLRAVDLELVIGRRQHQPFGVGTGFDLSAWRVGFGLLARL